MPDETSGTGSLMRAAGPERLPTQGKALIESSLLDQTLSEPGIRRLHDLLENADNAVVVLVDAHRKLVWGSARGSEHIFGRSRHDFVGTDPATYVHPEDRTAIIDFYRRIFEYPDTQSVTCRVHTSDLDWVTVWTVGWAVRKAHGRQLAVVISMPTH